MNIPWDDLFRRLRAGFDAVTHAVSSTGSRAKATVGRTASARFPFGATLAFNVTAEPGHEDVVVSVDCRASENALELTSDIARGDGYVVSDGPTRRGENAQAALNDLERWFDDVVAYLRANAPLIVVEVERAARQYEAASPPKLE